MFQNEFLNQRIRTLLLCIVKGDCNSNRGLEKVCPGQNYSFAVVLSQISKLLIQVNYNYLTT